MFTILAHAGHSHDTESANGVGMSDIEHCMPIIIGAGIIIVLLLGAVAYLLSAWQPKSRVKSGRVANTRTKK